MWVIGLYCKRIAKEIPRVFIHGSSLLLPWSWLPRMSTSFAFQRQGGPVVTDLVLLRELFFPMGEYPSRGCL